MSSTFGSHRRACDMATFHVAVRNDGNRYLSGCSLTLCGYNDSTSRYERVSGATVPVLQDEVMDHAKIMAMVMGSMTGRSIVALSHVYNWAH